MTNTAAWTDEQCTLFARLDAGQTIVLNRRKNGPHYRLWRHRCDHRPEALVWIGRPSGRLRERGSRWANPHKIPPGVSVEARLAAVAAYRRDLDTRPDLLAAPPARRQSPGLCASRCPVTATCSRYCPR